MRRKPYSDLLALANGGAASRGASPAALRPPARPLPVSSQHPAAAPITPAAAAKFRAELKILATMIDDHSRSTDSEGKKMCLFVGEKLTAASVALNNGDAEGSWFQLFGAAKLCRTFQVKPEEAERVIARLNSMLN